MIEAGYELDALIAKHVMGLEPRTFADGCPICNGPLYDVGTRARREYIVQSIKKTRGRGSHREKRGNTVARDVKR